MEINDIVFDHIELMRQTFDNQFNKLIVDAGDRIGNAFERGGKVILFGNGGSAADAQHISAEFVSKLNIDRIPLPSIALTVDTSALTAISNDYGYEKVFSRQVKALCGTNDVVIGISTSGRSKSIIRGLETARDIGAFTIGLTGQNGFKNFAPDISLNVPSQNTARIQEIHIIIGHIICSRAEINYV